MWLKKREWFTGVDNLTIVTPSKWLAGLVKESYLKEYPVRVINNGINLDVFKPTYSHFRKIYHCENKKILLGVAFDWGRRKGLDVINELADRLPTNYQIVIVGRLVKDPELRETDSGKKVLILVWFYWILMNLLAVSAPGTATASVIVVLSAGCSSLYQRCRADIAPAFSQPSKYRWLSTCRLCDKLCV